MTSGTSLIASPGGRRLAYGLAALLGLLAAALAGPIVLPPGVSALALAALIGLGGCGAGVMAWRQAGRLREATEKASSEIDTLSRRLIRLESRLAELERAGAEAGSESRGTTAELTGEIALLGSLVRDLAMSVAGQERAMAALQERAVAPPQGLGALQDRAAPRERAAPQERAIPPERAAPIERPAPRPEPVAAAPARPAPVAPSAPPPPHEPARPGPAAPRDGAIAAALRADRIEVHLQPVVALPQRKLRFYEATAHLRLSDDELLGPAEIGPALERAALTPELDARMVARAAAVARHLAARGSDAVVACALAPASLRTPGFLRALGRVLEGHPDVLERLVLSISQRCWRTLEAETAGAMAALRARGVAFALDRAADLRLDPLTLADRGVRYVKLPADLLLRSSGIAAADYAMADLAAVLARAGIRLVAEGVEREGDVPDLIELDVPLAQGTVFAPPRAVRPEVLGGAPAPRPAEPARSAPPLERTAPRPGIAILPPEAARASERVPLRSLLRRAL